MSHSNNENVLYESGLIIENIFVPWDIEKKIGIIIALKILSSE